MGQDFLDLQQYKNRKRWYFLFFTGFNFTKIAPKNEPCSIEAQSFLPQNAALRTIV